MASNSVLDEPEKKKSQWTQQETEIVNRLTQQQLTHNVPRAAFSPNFPSASRIDFRAKNPEHPRSVADYNRYVQSAIQTKTANSPHITENLVSFKDVQIRRIHILNPSTELEEQYRDAAKLDWSTCNQSDYKV